MAIICHCEGVRERTIAKAIDRGAHTLAGVQDACRAGTQCGGCLPAIEALLAERGHAPVPAAGEPAPPWPGPAPRVPVRAG